MPWGPKQETGPPKLGKAAVLGSRQPLSLYSERWGVLVIALVQMRDPR